MNRRLVYILNHVNENDATHFGHVLNLLAVMKQRGWSVVVLSEKGGVGTRTLAGLPITFLSKSSVLSRALHLVTNLLWLRTRGYRLVFVRISKFSAIVSALLGRMIGLEVLYWQSGTVHDFDRRKPLLRRVIDGIAGPTLNWAVDSFVSGPESMLEYYATQCNVPRFKLRLLYNDIDLHRFVPGNVQRGCQTACRILLVHRFSPVRQAALYMPAIVGSLSRAAAEGRQLELLFIGDGPEQDLVKELVAPLQGVVTVQFLGAIPNADLPRHYREADIFIMPSYREGFPRVLLEAMATGLPIVATDAGGSRELFGPIQRSYVVSRDDPDGFADRLSELVRDAPRRAALAAENLRQVQKYSTESVAPMFEELLLARLPLGAVSE